MGVDTTILLLLAGSIAAAVAIGISAYKGLFGSRRIVSKMTFPTVDSQITQQTNTQSATIQVQSRVDETEQSSNANGSQPIQEAPAPFPEDNVSSVKTPVPMDISSVSGVTTVAASASPVLVIATPKRRARSTTRRLPTAGTAQATPRRRKSAKQQHAVIPETVAPTVSTSLVETTTQVVEPQPTTAPTTQSSQQEA